MLRRDLAVHREEIFERIKLEEADESAHVGARRPARGTRTATAMPPNGHGRNRTPDSRTP